MDAEKKSSQDEISGNEDDRGDSNADQDSKLRAFLRKQVKGSRGAVNGMVTLVIAGVIVTWITGTFHIGGTSAGSGPGASLSSKSPSDAPVDYGARHFTFTLPPPPSEGGCNAARLGSGKVLVQSQLGDICYGEQGGLDEIGILNGTMSRTLNATTFKPSLAACMALLRHPRNPKVQIKPVAVGDAFCADPQAAGPAITY
jgi:hypothetical protein